MVAKVCKTNCRNKEIDAVSVCLESFHGPSCISNVSPYVGMVAILVM